MLRKKTVSLTFLMAAMGTILFWAVRGAGEMAQPQDIRQTPGVPKPQGFCGYCHLLTYPSIIEKSYNSWLKGKHNRTGCVECHYPPLMAGDENPAQVEAASEKPHIPNGPPKHFSFLYLGGETVQTRPRISDSSCITMACHGRPEDTFKTKKILLKEKIRYIHEHHLLEKNQIPGQKTHCTTCHQHENDQNHFEVNKALCHLCHFANTRFNEGRARCNLCHDLPSKPIQSSDNKPITHRMLEDAGVACASCHFDLLQNSEGVKIEAFFDEGALKTIPVIGGGVIKKENCLSCHDQAKYIKEAGNKELLHLHHVANKNARCFDCHQPIQHAKGDVNKPMPSDCAACHRDPHRYQRFLAAGPEHRGIPHLPDPMYKARTNCLGCHVEKKFSEKGQEVRTASARTCILCHNRDYDKMLEMWKTELSREMSKAQLLEQQALKILSEKKPSLPEEKLSRARKLFMEGREDLSIVQFGNGVHNAKYSASLLGAAITRFKDTIALLEGRELEAEVIEE